MSGVAREWLLVRNDRAFWILVVILVVCLGYGSISGIAWVRSEQAQAEFVRGEEAARLAALADAVRRLEASRKHEGTPWTDPRSADAVGRVLGRRWAVLPITPLAALSIGQSDVHASALRISVRTRETSAAEGRLGNPLSRLLGRFDIAFVVIVVLPLVVIAACHDVLAGDREAGRLTLAVAGSASVRALLAVRLLWRAGLIATCAIGVPVVATVMIGRPGAPDGAILALWMLVVVAYVAFWTVAAGLVNALPTRAATNLVLLVGLWAILVVAAPALVRLAVTAAYPMSSRASLVLAMREASSAEATRASQVLARLYEAHPELVPDARRSVTPEYVIPFYAAMQRVDERLRPVLAAFEEQVARQQAMVTRWRFVSPALVAREAFDAVAGTGVDRHRAFIAQVDRYHDEYQGFFRDRVVSKRDLTANDYAAMPRFVFTEPSRSSVGRAVAAGAAGVGVITAVLAIATAYALRRTQVTP